MTKEKRKYLNVKELANPCMKCGSVECAVCSEDIKLIHKKLTQRLKEKKKYKEEVGLVNHDYQVGYTDCIDDVIKLINRFLNYN